METDDTDATDKLSSSDDDTDVNVINDDDDASLTIVVLKRDDGTLSSGPMLLKLMMILCVLNDLFGRIVVVHKQKGVSRYCVMIDLSLLVFVSKFSVLCSGNAVCDGDELHVGRDE